MSLPCPGKKLQFSNKVQSLAWRILSTGLGSLACSGLLIDWPSQNVSLADSPSEIGSPNDRAKRPSSGAWTTPIVSDTDQPRSRLKLRFQTQPWMTQAEKAPAAEPEIEPNPEIDPEPVPEPPHYLAAVSLPAASAELAAPATVSDSVEKKIAAEVAARSEASSAAMSLQPPQLGGTKAAPAAGRVGLRVPPWNEPARTAEVESSVADRWVPRGTAVPPQPLRDPRPTDITTKPEPKQSAGQSFVPKTVGSGLLDGPTTSVDQLANRPLSHQTREFDNEPADELADEPTDEPTSLDQADDLTFQAPLNQLAADGEESTDELAEGLDDASMSQLSETDEESTSENKESAESSEDLEWMSKSLRSVPLRALVGPTEKVTSDASDAAGSDKSSSDAGTPDQTTARSKLEPTLKPLGRGADLRDIRQERLGQSKADQKTESARQRMEKRVESGETEKSLNEDSRPTPVLANLDATGRPRQHDGKGAAANLSRTILRMKRPIQQTLQYYYGQRENADRRSNWGMMHQVMVYGVETRLIARGREHSTIAWMAGNNICRGSRLMTVEQGQLQVREGVGLQGHQAQWLAVLSLAGVPADYPLYVGRNRFSVEDLVRTEAAACEEGKELTFTLIGLAYYLDTETSWVGADGERWDFPRLIAYELTQPIVGAACGGTHRLMGFAHALRKRRMEGRPLDGQWYRAEKYLDDFTEYTFRLQNRDGSMSTNWYESQEDNGELDRKIQTTGHMVEFLLTHLPDEEIVKPRMVRSINFLMRSMLRNRRNDWSIGPKGHALRSLAMFYERVYGDGPAVDSEKVAGRQRQRRR